jgi:hypothetical protein
MQTTKPSLHRERNLETYQKHKKEVLWQITVPLVAAGVIVLLMMAVSLSSEVDQSRLADISLIWIIIPNLAAALFAIFILAAMVYGLIKLISILPYYAYKTQMFFKNVDARIRSVDNRMVEPFIKGKTSSASFRKLIEQLFLR